MTNYITAVGVQQFSITIASGSTTGIATISAVGSGAFIIPGGLNPSVSNNLTEDDAYLTLTNPTTITATRNNGTAGTIVITGCIIDGDTTNLIKSIQFGTISLASTSGTGTATIAAVTNANTALAYLGASEGSIGWTSQQGVFLSLSGVTVTATRGSGAGIGTATVGFVVVEFQSACLNQATQNISASSGSFVTSWTAAVTSVNSSNAICFYCGQNNSANNTNPAQTFLRGSLTSSTVFTINVNTANLNTRTLNAVIVEFVAGVLNSAVQRGTTTLTGVTSNTSAITGVVLGNSGIICLGNTATSTTAVLDRAEGAIALTTGILVTGTKTTATGNITISWEVFEFTAFSGSVTVNAWYPSVNFTPLPIVPPYVFMGYLADEVLNLPIPFLPHLPDVAPRNPPAPPSSVAMNVQAISTSTPLRFFPSIAAAPPLTPADRPNYFAPRWLLNLPIPWLPARGVDAPPIVPPDKPNYFAPGWLLNLPMPWQSRIVDAAPRALAAVPNFFAGIPAIISAVVSIPWFPRVSDAPRLTPADKPNYFAPRWLLNLSVPWMPKISTDAPPLTPAAKPNIFSPVFALNFRLPWLPRISDAPPVTPPDRPNFFSFPIPLNFRLPWLPRIADAPKVTPPDRQSIFSFPLAINFRLPWLIRSADAPAMPKPDRQSIFMPDIKSAILSWLPIISHAPAVPRLEKQSIFSPPWIVAAPVAWFSRFVSADAPRLPLADKPNFFSLVFRFVPGSGVFGRIIDPLRQNRTVSPKMQSRTVDPGHQNRTLNPDSDGRILDPRSQKRIL